MADDSGIVSFHCFESEHPWFGRDSVVTAKGWRKLAYLFGYLLIVGFLIWIVISGFKASPNIG